MEMIVALLVRYINFISNACSDVSSEEYTKSSVAHRATNP